MAGIEDGIADYMENHAGISALVGNRIYPMVLPDEATYPAIVYQKISGLMVASHSGNSGLGNPRFQISCWGETYPVAKALSRQVKLAFHGYKGAMGDITCQAAFVDAELDDMDQQTKLFRVMIDVLLWHAEAKA